MLPSWGHLLSVGVHSSYRTPILFYSVLFCGATTTTSQGILCALDPFPNALSRGSFVRFIRADVELKSISQLVISASINVASDKASALMCPLNSHTHTTHTPAHTLKHNMHQKTYIDRLQREQDFKLGAPKSVAYHTGHTSTASSSSSNKQQQ